MRQTWKILKCAINKKPKNTATEISEIFFNNTLISDPTKIAETFNEFFCSEPTNIVNNIHRFEDLGAPETDTPEQDPYIFKSSDLQVGHEELRDALSKIESKNSTDHFGLSMKFIKKCFNVIINPFLHIINLSFSTGCIPHQLKLAKVIPIFKSGDPRLPNNYRPISLLSNFSKIIEKVMYIRLSNFLEHHDLLSLSQFGFRTNHSTIHPMILLDNFVTDALNNKKYAMAIFCDLRKAFDTVNHSLLLSKLERMGVRDKELLWFKNYLSGRWQYTVVGGGL